MFIKSSSYKEYYSYLKPNFKIIFQSSLYNYLYEIIGLSTRLYIQIKRRPSNLFAGLIQPLIWLVLFGALFQKMMLNFQIPYTQFLNTGIIIFTSFTSAMNSGLPIIFDREFGFLNRLIISPILSRYSILISSSISIILITLFQTNTIIAFNISILKYQYNIHQIISTVVIVSLLTLTISNISICLAFILPGHIEFLALILIINLPILFSSTALAPLSFMPYWLKIITCLNPITYAIEILRFISIYDSNNIDSLKSIFTLGININIYHSILILTLINISNCIFTKYIIKYKCE